MRMSNKIVKRRVSGNIDGGKKNLCFSSKYEQKRGTENEFFCAFLCKLPNLPIILNVDHCGGMRLCSSAFTVSNNLRARSVLAERERSLSDGCRSGTSPISNDNRFSQDENIRSRYAKWMQASGGQTVTRAEHNFFAWCRVECTEPRS